jgi:DEAD/DEAH box helicase domain-containing protein
LTIEQIIDQLQRDPSFLQNVSVWKKIESREAQYADFPDAIDARLVRALTSHGIQKPYTHQAEAIDHILNQRNTTIVTPTASGKTLCYNVPVLNSVIETKEARALYLFPTKALSQDQVSELHNLIKLVSPEIDFDIKSYTFDGDTPQTARRAIRSSGHIVVTNPDMLHTGILPHHTIWVKLFENLRYVVIDEIHHYRGVFGSHLANVIRRLKRICAFYNSRPQFICCSATIANPGELAQALTGEPMQVVDQNGAPRGAKHFILYNPPVVNQELGIRRSYVKEAQELATRFLRHNVQTIVFARSRMRVEILITYLKQHLKEKAQKIRGYRGGYLPLQRREIERGLRSGDIIGVVSTNALELGIDIGQLQVCIMAGYPGTIASTWQQSGRAGRRSGTSLAILVSSSAPLDQHITHHPEYLLDKSPESGIVDPDNLIILLSHIKCAAFELPFRSSERFGSDHENNGGVEGTNEILEFLQENKVVHFSNDSWHWMAETYPAESISLRSAAEENVVIIEQQAGLERVIGEIDLFAAPMMVHDDAIYIHESQQYHVDQLDWERRKAYVHPVRVDYYTDAQLKTNLKVLEIEEEEPLAIGKKGYGEIVVTSLATMYKKIKFNTHENVGWGKIHLPELEMHTTSFWYSFPEDMAHQLQIEEQQFGDAMKGVANVLQNIVPLYVMGDPKDFQAQPMMRSPLWKLPTVFVWERYPGGVGFSRKLYHNISDIAHAGVDLVTRCGCKQGCPSCVGPVLEVGQYAKKTAHDLLESIRSSG